MNKSYPIYFIHGYKGAPENFANFKKYYPNATYISLPWHFAEYKEHIFDRDFCLTYLKKIITRKGILVGHSLGGLLSQEFAIAYPELVERVFLIGYPLDDNTYNFQSTRNRALSHRNKNELHLKGIDIRNMLFGNFLFSLLFFMPPHQRVSIQKYFFVPGRIKANIFEHLLIYNMLDRVKRIKVPVIFINGGKDLNNNKISSNFKSIGPSFILPRMGHNFTEYETQIMLIIKQNLS